MSSLGTEVESILGKMWLALVCPAIAVRQAEPLRKLGCDSFSNLHNHTMADFFMSHLNTHIFRGSGKNTSPNKIALESYLY